MLKEVLLLGHCAHSSTQWQDCSNPPGVRDEVSLCSAIAICARGMDCMMLGSASGSLGIERHAADCSTIQGSTVGHC